MFFVVMDWFEDGLVTGFFWSLDGLGGDGFEVPSPAAAA